MFGKKTPGARTPSNVEPDEEMQEGAQPSMPAPSAAMLRPGANRMAPAPQTPPPVQAKKTASVHDLRPKKFQKKGE